MRQFTCPSGHKLDETAFSSYVDMKVPDIDDAVIFNCPGGKRGHTFTLRKAVNSRMFNIEEAAKIRESGIKTRDYGLTLSAKEGLIEPLQSEIL